MAKLTGPVKFIGTIGELNTYQIEGSQEVYARAKGGPSSKAVKRGKNFVNTRRNNAEFTGVNIVVARIKRSMAMLDCFRDYNYTPILNGLCLDLQKMDATQVWGERGYQFSLYGHLLEGFNLNDQVFFSSIVRPTIECRLDREAGTATLTIPTLKPGRNLFLPWKTPTFRFVITLDTIEDTSWKGEKYAEGGTLSAAAPTILCTPWYFSDDTLAGQTVTLQLKNPIQPEATQTMLVCIGIQGGAGAASEKFTPKVKKKHCAAKMLKLG